MADEVVHSEKYVDYRRNPNYGRRVVVFYDVLGWRNHIERAGKDTKAVGDLRRLVLQHSRITRLRTSLEIRVSTFSDNVVLTQEPGPKTQMLVQQMAIFQVASAMGGYLLRGGITIGEIIHEDEVVFGPGLNRAYYLESKVARFPRFVLDPDHMAEFGNLGDLPVKEDSVTFLNSFTLDFCDHLRRGKVEEPSEAFAQAGLPMPSTWHKKIERATILELILDSLKPQIRGPTPDRDYEKIAWLYDRIAKQLGVPLSRSYPRVRLEDVVE